MLSIAISRVGFGSPARLAPHTPAGPLTSRLVVRLDSRSALLILRAGVLVGERRPREATPRECRLRLLGERREDRREVAIARQAQLQGLTAEARRLPLREVDVDDGHGC